MSGPVFARILAAACACAALAHLAAFPLVAMLRMGYPFELEWMEGGTLEEVQRLVRGQELYPAPSLEFVPFIYTPLYFHLGAALARVLGGGFLPLRLLSFLAAVGCLAVIFQWVKKSTGSWRAALLSAGLFAATFKASGFWFDLARVDSLFLFFLLAGLALLRKPDPPMRAAAAALCLSAAYLTKQSALPVMAAVTPWVLFQGWNQASAFLAAAAVGVPAATWLLAKRHGGWFSHYVFALPSQHPWVDDPFGFWYRDLAAQVPLALALGALAVVLAFRQGRKNEGWFLALCAAGMLGESWLSRLHTGGWDNVLMPAHALLAVLFGLGYAAASQRAAKPAWAMGLSLLCLLQLAWMRYDPRRQIPGGADARAGLRVVKAIADETGEVYVPDHGYLADLAGKKPLAHRMAVQDALRGKSGPASQALTLEIKTALAARRFSALILDYRDLDEAGIFPASAQRYYRLVDSLFSGEGRDFMTVTGVKIRPSYIFRPTAADDEDQLVYEK